MRKKILPLAILSLFIFKAYSQNFVSQAIRGERGISKQFAAIPNNQNLKFNTAQVKALLNLNDNAVLILKRTEQDRLGFIHFRFYQLQSILQQSTPYQAPTNVLRVDSLLCLQN